MDTLSGYASDERSTHGVLTKGNFEGIPDPPFQTNQKICSLSSTRAFAITSRRLRKAQTTLSPDSPREDG